MTLGVITFLPSTLDFYVRALKNRNTQKVGKKIGRFQIDLGAFVGHYISRPWVHILNLWQYSVRCLIGSLWANIKVITIT